MLKKARKKTCVPSKMKGSGSHAGRCLAKSPSAAVRKAASKRLNELRKKTKKR